MSRFVKVILLVVFIVFGYVYFSSYFLGGPIEKEERVVLNKMRKDIAPLLASWNLAEDSTLFIKEIRVQDLKFFFKKMEEVHGSCKFKEMPVCVSQEREVMKDDKYKTEYGASVECAYQVICEKKETTGAVVFKKTGHDSYQISDFNIN